jgi:hypothetical protein
VLGEGEFGARRLGEIPPTSMAVFLQAGVCRRIVRGPRWIGTGSIASGDIKHSTRKVKAVVEKKAKLKRDSRKLKRAGNILKRYNM